MIKKIYLPLCIFSLFVLPHFLFAEFVAETDSQFVITTNSAALVIPKDNGMLTSARVHGVDFEISSDYTDYCLFFTEFAIQMSQSTKEIFTTSNRKTHGGTVDIVDYYLTDDFVRIKFRWENKYILTQWSYHIFRDRKYFYINLDREVKKSWVYANHQQCIMTNPDFDNFYLVNYENKWFQTMDKGNVGAGAHEGASRFQHTIFSSIDKGQGTRFPATGWYQTERDVTFGVIVSNVSDNQRATFAYHGGGRTKEPRHPGFSEFQYDWFGKSDTEALYLREGATYSMQMIYYFTKGAIDSLDNLNQKLFNERHFDLREHENYYAASWGGRHVYLAEYTWTFPQASNNFICSQELFRHRAISIPRSQNGTADPHLFDIVIKGEVDGNEIDLSPIPQVHGSGLLHKSAKTNQGSNWMQGEVVWEIQHIQNQLAYKMHEMSDKLVVEGNIKPDIQARLNRLWVEIVFSPRVQTVKKLDPFTWDIRSPDTIFDEIGVTLYEMQGIQSVRNFDDRLELVLYERPQWATGYDTSRVSYAFKLFPHREFALEDVSQITPFFDLPVEWYREYFQAFPELDFDNHFGVRADNRLVITAVSTEPDSNIFFTAAGFAEKGNYSLHFFLENQQIKSLKLNGYFIESTRWQYVPGTGELKIDNEWNGPFELELCKQIALNVDSFEVVQFDAQFEADRVVLTWAMNIETLTARFDIFRSEVSQSKKVLIADKIRDYSFIDQTHQPNITYTYELKMYVDGFIKFYGPVVIRIPRKPGLSCANFPNPFNSATTIYLDIEPPGRVTIKIYNSLGQLVKVLDNELPASALGRVLWDGTDEVNQMLPSGVYLYSASFQEKIFKGKMVLLR